MLLLTKNLFDGSFGGRARPERSRYAQKFFVPHRRLRGLDGNRNREFRFGSALERAACRRHVGIIASNGDANMAVARQNVVRRIEPDPAQARKIGFDPGMRGILAGAVLILAPVMQISRNIARRNPPASCDRNRNMCEILANTALFRNREIDRRIDFCHSDFIVEGIMDGFAQALERGQRIAPGFFEIVCLHKRRQCRRRLGEFRGLEKIEMICRQIISVKPLPFELIGRLRRRPHIRQFDNRLRFDTKLFMSAQHVEMINRVAQVIRIRIKLGAGICRYLETSERLGTFRARLHA